MIAGDYTFKSGQTYLVRGPVTITGKTTIQGGAVIKFDDDSTGSLRIERIEDQEKVHLKTNFWAKVFAG